MREAFPSQAPHHVSLSPISSKVQAHQWIYPCDQEVGHTCFPQSGTSPGDGVCHLECQEWENHQLKVKVLLGNRQTSTMAPSLVLPFSFSGGCDFFHFTDVEMEVQEYGLTFAKALTNKRGGTRPENQVCEAPRPRPCSQSAPAWPPFRPVASPRCAPRSYAMMDEHGSVENEIKNIEHNDNNQIALRRTNKRV